MGTLPNQSVHIRGPILERSWRVCVRNGVLRSSRSGLHLRTFPLAQHRRCLVVARGATGAYSATRERNANDDHVRFDRYETNGDEAAGERAPAGYFETESPEKKLTCGGRVLPAHLCLDPDP